MQQWSLLTKSLLCLSLPMEAHSDDWKWDDRLAASPRFRTWWRGCSDHRLKDRH